MAAAQPTAVADPLESDLNQLEMSRGDFMTQRPNGAFIYNTTQLEARYLTLLEHYPEKEEKARVYFALVDMYCQTGLTDPDSAVQYAHRALALPLDPQLQIPLYHKLGDAMQVQNRGVTGAELVRARKEVAVPYLKGIKLALECGLPELPLEVPVVPRMDASEGVDQDLLQQHQQQVEARRQAQLVNRMVQDRAICGDQLVFLYTRRPYATDELRAMASEILGNEKTVAQLVARVEAAIRQRADEEAAQASREVAQDLIPHAEPESPITLPPPQAPAAEHQHDQPTPNDAPGPEDPPTSRSQGHGLVWVAAACAAFAAAAGTVAAIKRKRSTH